MNAMNPTVYVVTARTGQYDCDREVRNVIVFSDWHDANGFIGRANDLVVRLQTDQPDRWLGRPHEQRPNPIFDAWWPAALRCLQAIDPKATDWETHYDFDNVPTG